MKKFLTAVVIVAASAITLISMSIMFVSTDIFPVENRGFTKEDVLFGSVFFAIVALLSVALSVCIYALMKRRKISKLSDRIAFAIQTGGCGLFMLLLCVSSKFSFRPPVLVGLCSVLIAGIVPLSVLLVRGHKLRKQ